MAEPSKQEISQVFKGLRTVGSNKVILRRNNIDFIRLKFEFVWINRESDNKLNAF